MSNEITASIRLAAKKAELDFLFSTGQKLFNMAGTKAGTPGLQTITTTDTAIDFGDISSVGWYVVQNLSDTYSCDFGPDSGGSIVPCNTIPPKGFLLGYKKSGATLRAQAIGDTVNLVILGVEV